MSKAFDRIFSIQVFLSISFLLLVLYVSLQVVLPKVVRWQLLAYLRQGAPNALFDLDLAQVEFFPPKIILKGLSAIVVDSHRMPLLSLTKINGQCIIGFKTIAVTFHGLLEQSGIFKLDFVFPTSRAEQSFDADILITDLKLSDLDRYLISSDGIALAGDLIRAQSHFEVRGKKLNGWVAASYKKLSVQFKKTKERSTLSSLASNFVAAVRVNSQNSDTPYDLQRHVVGAVQADHESLLHFVFRPLLAGFIRIASGKN